MCPCAFFSPSLDPVLEGRKGHKHAVITPEMPAGGAGVHALFDHQTHRHVYDTMGVMTAGWRDIGEVDVAILLACCTGVRGVRHQQVHRVTGGEITEVVQRPLSGFVARGELGASWARRVRLVTAVRHTLRCWEVLDGDNPRGGVWHVYTRSEHTWLSWGKRLGPAV